MLRFHQYLDPRALWSEEVREAAAEMLGLNERGSVQEGDYQWTTDIARTAPVGRTIVSNAPGYRRAYPGMVFNTSGNELGCLASAADDQRRAGSESFCL